ncbi:hypothetical protein Sjap_019652 [Stephania japonica]|uniref:Beta-galactosidase n=1 Tax=Stephania japonica TaxID=461633 RepID=A0AAP0F6H6_9MAGN
MGSTGSGGFVLLSALCILLCWCCCTSSAIDVSYDGRAIKIDGQRRVLLSGSIHYPRSTPDMWPDLIQKSKEGGLDTIETYVFWNAHEPRRREYDFLRNLDLVRFIKTIQDAGLYVVLRIGPYVCAEWNYGGYPVWLHNLPGIEIRTDNEVYKNEMQIFTTFIVDMMKKEKLFASQGGPIIIAQIENEFGNVMTPYGDAGKVYINWCATMAESLNIGVPWIMCQQPDAPQPMINTCNGYYCDDFTPNNPNSPKMWTENWTGWFKDWGMADPHRTAEDLAYSVARFFQFGGTFQNYYMYHGGTNFGRTAGGPYITTSYDYDAPLDEYGHLNQPKWGHLKELHLLLKSMEKVLTYGDISTTDNGNSVTATTYTVNGTFSCFISNANTTADATVELQGKTFTVPAWSVSILPDCKNDVYNTAKINVQTSVKVMKPNAAEKQPAALNWAWRPERVRDTASLGQGPLVAEQLLEQKQVSNDSSDYVWYMTRIDLKKGDPLWSNDMTLRVNSSAHILHVFVNGKHVGVQWATKGVYKYVVEQKVALKLGKNQLSLLSVTVGLQNYGSFFDEVTTGIEAVQLISKGSNNNDVVKDLSTNKWVYRVGLHGEEKQLYSVESQLHSSRWQEQNLPINRLFTWYKTNFQAPLGKEPVVVDLQGLGKGHAWVNGRSIGRYWPSFNAQEDGCTTTCDYRGPYGSDKCLTNCGKPSQRWYHVPRSFLRDDMNTLVLFEELGGNPSFVNFQSVAVGTVCANTSEGHTLELSCHGSGRTISTVKFASFGEPQGSCGSFSSGTCEASGALAIVQQACVGRERCSIEVSEATFGSTGCSNANRLAVEVVC